MSALSKLKLVAAHAENKSPVGLRRGSVLVHWKSGELGDRQQHGGIL